MGKICCNGSRIKYAKYLPHWEWIEGLGSAQYHQPVGEARNSLLVAQLQEPLNGLNFNRQEHLEVS